MELNILVEAELKKKNTGFRLEESPRLIRISLAIVVLIVLPLPFLSSEEAQCCYGHLIDSVFITLPLLFSFLLFLLYIVMLRWRTAIALLLLFFVLFVQRTIVPTYYIHSQCYNYCPGLQ